MRALDAVLRELSRELGPAEIQAHDAPSGVRETPLNRAEVMRGAWNRAQAVRTLAPSADFWVGMEGGLHIETAGWGLAAGAAGASSLQSPDPTLGWLESWACVSTGARTYFGCGGSIPLPGVIIDAVARDGRSLAQVIDELSGKQDVRSGEGTWGILTGGRLTREAVFRRALLNAFAPFYGPIRF